MDDPIKIIWKYKNKHRRIQYHTYIFVGPISSETTKILNKMADLSLYGTWIELSRSEISILEKKYGSKWYNKFFNSYHVSNTINIVKETNSQRRELTEKFGKEWIESNIDINDIIDKKILYSYEVLFKDEQTRKTIKKGRTMAISEEDMDVDYRTVTKDDLNKIFETRTKLRRTEIENISSEDSNMSDSSDIIQEGGVDEDTILDEVVEVGEKDDEDHNPFEQGIDSGELISDDEELDMLEIEEMYKDVDVNPDENINQTSSLIKKALNDDKLFEKKVSLLVSFDTSKDNTIYDESLRDVYKKYYVTLYYIFKDDTIKTIKDKICASIKNNPIFEKNSYVVPSRQYLWGQYIYQGKIEKVMMGQKWVRRNEILNIDVEPNNNIHYYEELRGNLKTLRDNIRRYGNKIRREDDDTNILFDYENYYSSNEIFMIDLYNDLGKNYKVNAEIQKNLLDVYLRIYYPKVKVDDLKYVLDYLNGDIKVESDKISTIYETITNDLVMESEIMYMVEESKKNLSYKKVFRDNFITQSVIHVNLRMYGNRESKIDLYRIFNEFTPTTVYPFIQYQTPDGQIVFKYHEEEITNYLKIKENADVLSKWFENAPYGISFKVKIKERNVDKFMAINLNENGRIEYKTQWKEEDMATIEDIKKTYEYVKTLIRRLNEDRNKVRFDIPDNGEFKYAFINTIQKFELPEKFIINHNDLSEFSRYFYPYVALVIEPRKRQAKIQKGTDKSKFGTYLRYKRVSKYENQARIEQRIMYFMRNYEYQEQLLSNEISKQFNITEDRAKEEIDKVKMRYPNIKKSRKILKKLENIPKYKPPGIGIDIQGKQREKYKIRISGARDKAQLDRIITFMNILIYLYIETYLLKNPDRQILKEKLKKLNNIARRRNKVDEVVNYSREIKSVKQMAQLDKRRIGFKPEKGQNQWTRACQNSGNDKKRRPQQYTSLNMEEILKKGYSLNKKTGHYERKVILKGRQGKGREVVLKTIKLQEYDDEGNQTGNEIHYACSPDENGEHMYVGFLTRSTNPFGQCMPCCFKKDPTISKNREKRDFHLKCLGQIKKTDEDTKLTQKIAGDKLYILQDTNKIQEGRFGFLPKYLDFFFNLSLDKQKKIKHHYLVKSETGYFYKFGTKQDEYQFLNAVSANLDLSINEIKNRLIEILENDKMDQIFTFLNNGDIKTQFTTRDKYIDYIKYNSYLDFEVVNDLLSVPGVIDDGGLNIIIFQKKIITIKKTFEKEKIKEDFYLMCQNNEDVFKLLDTKRKTIFMLKENRNYYPIVMVHKSSEDSRTINIIKTFLYEDKHDNIVNHIKPFYEKNCYGSLLDDIIHKKSSLTAKMTHHILNLIGDKNFIVKYQYIDVRNKCKYLITNSNLLIPVRPSGSLHNIQIVKSIDKYINSFDVTYNNLNNLYNKIKKNHYLPIKPIGVYYDERHGQRIKIIAVMIKTRDIVPVSPIEKDIKDLENLGLIYENKPLFDKIDKEILGGKDNYLVDNRITSVNEEEYLGESYELFRLEFSEFISDPSNITIKERIEAIINDNILAKRQKVNKIKLIIYRLIDGELYKIYRDTINETGQEEFIQTGGVKDKPYKFIHVVNKLPDISNYQLKNDREICSINKNKDQCSTNPHCSWYQDECYMGLNKNMIINFTNRISEELALGELRAQEILKIGNYFVSDIVDYSKFKERSGQKIIRSSNNTIKKVLNELFGKDNIPRIGRRKNVKLTEINYQQMNLENPLRDLKEYYSQEIIDNNLSIFRAYSNAFYWIRHPYFDIENRNLGYYSLLQTDLATYFRSAIIDWLNDSKNYKLIHQEIVNYMEIKKSSKNIISEFIVRLANDVATLTNDIVELYILNMIQKIPIVVYNDDNEITYIFDDGIIYHYKRDKVIPKKSELYTSSKKHTVINLRFSFITHVSIPDEIEVLYIK